MHPAISGGGEVTRICPDPFHEGEYEFGAVYRDAKGELYMRTNGLRYPWGFLDASGEVMEPRDEDFPHKPLVKLVPER